MMSSGINPINGDDSAMPGNYESWSAPAARDVPFPGPLPPRPMIPPMRTPFPRLPSAPPNVGPPGRTPFPRIPPTGGPPMRPGPMIPTGRPLRFRRHRRRPLTPEIVIERRPHRHSSSGRRHMITVPLDHRPTLGLRGPPRRVIEIERVRCHRRRRPRSVCYEYDYDDPPPPPAQPPIIVANPVATQFLPAAQQPIIVPVTNTAAATTTTTFLSNLTQEAIDNLPRQTVHLPPIHLPGSQADANTELHTVIFPAEIINPVDGTLSIIQANPGMNNVVATNIQPITAATVQPQFINIPATVGVPVAPRRQPVSPAMAGDPLMQRFRELFQRLSIPQTQPMVPAPNPPMIRPILPNMSQFNPTNNLVNDPPIIPPINTANIGGYPPANIRPANPLNIGSYRPTIPGNMPTYRPTTITPSGPVSNMSYRPTNITPSGPFSTTSYTPANTTSYRPSSFTPSASVNNATYRPTNIIPSDLSDIGPYQPANITPYSNTTTRSSYNPLSQPSFPSGPTAYTSTPSAPSGSFTPFPRLSSLPSGIGNNSLNPSFSSPSLAPIPNQSINSMPKSILRNTSSIGPSNTTYTSLTSPNVMSSNDIVRKTTRFT